MGEIVSGPTIRYDKADRSLGQASLTYKELPHAIKAFQSFNGAIAKGQPIAIKYDRTPQPPALLARLDGTATSTKSRNPFDTKLFSETPYSRSPRTSLGTTDRKPRTSLPRNSNDGSDSRDRRGPRQSNERRPAPNSNKREKKPASKTADELDRELDNFMKTPIVSLSHHRSVASLHRRFVTLSLCIASSVAQSTLTRYSRRSSQHRQQSRSPSTPATSSCHNLPLISRPRLAESSLFFLTELSTKQCILYESSRVNRAVRYE